MSSEAPLSDVSEPVPSTTEPNAPAPESPTPMSIWVDVRVEGSGSEPPSKTSFEATQIRKDPVVRGNIEITLRYPVPMQVSSSGILMAQVLSVPSKDVLNWYAGQMIALQSSPSEGAT